MKIYTKDEISIYVQRIINESFNSPQRIAVAFRANLKGKVKSLSRKELTDQEIETNSLRLAADILNELFRISREIISSKISDEVLNKNSNGELEFSEYQQYFEKLAKDLVRELINAKFKAAKKSISSAKKKRKR